MPSPRSTADGDNDGTTASGAAGSLSGLFDFGADVGINPPPPDQVTDVTAKLGQLGDSLGG